MKAFITGATGFVGSHVARALAAEGADLRLLVRPTSRTENIVDLRAETAVGDLREPESLKKAMEGCEFVFHVAADYRLWVRDPEQMYRANVEGTRAIIRAARERIRRFRSETWWDITSAQNSWPSRLRWKQEAKARTWWW
jgi:dihydroflavonol-4-reductase